MNRILECVDAVRGKLSEKNRTIAESLLVQRVHNRDIVKHLVANNAKPNDSSWMLNFKAYETGSGGEYRVDSAVIPIGGEYIDPRGRLVITPLTDRAYITMA